MEAATPKEPARYDLWVAIAISLFAAVAFYFSTNPTLHDLDYTAEIASAFLRGDLGLREKPPEWLNEMIPYGDRYYSAFPLGAVLSMIPIALLQKARLIHNFPAHVLASLIAGCCVYFFFQLAKAFGANYSSLEPSSFGRRILLALFPVFGTWTWCNLGFGGAWQIALGLALLGQTAALYFTLVRPSPLIAGTFFALAYGNRTELLITAPLYLYFFWQRSDRTSALWSRSMIKQELGKNGRMAIRFLSVPVCLAILTAAYNFARFHSIFDFGYTHIPEVHEEPCTSTVFFRSRLFPGTSTRCYFRDLQVFPTFHTSSQTGLAAQYSLPAPFCVSFFARAENTRSLHGWRSPF